MANIQYIRDDIVNTTAPIIAHGCNMQGVMGSGVAKALRSKWPEIFTVYNCKCLDRFFDLGDVDLVRLNTETSPFYVANILTQFNYGNDGKKYASYEALIKGLNNLALIMTLEIGWTYSVENRKVVAMPFIGCGLGGLIKSAVIELIQEILVDKYNIDVDIYFK